MLVTRNTSRFPTDEVKRLVKYAVSDVDMRRVCINVKGSTGGHWGGYAYQVVPRMSNAPPSSRYLITIRIAPDVSYPYAWQYKKRSELQVFENWQELLVSCAAHEAKHIEQFKEGLKLSELRCESFAVHVLKRYRESLALPLGLTHAPTN